MKVVIKSCRDCPFARHTMDGNMCGHVQAEPWTFTAKKGVADSCPLKQTTVTYVVEVT